MHKEMRWNCVVDVYDIEDEEKVNDIQYELEHNGCTCSDGECKYICDYDEKTNSWYCEKLDKVITKCECDVNTLQDIAQEIYEEMYDKYVRG